MDSEYRDDKFVVDNIKNERIDHALKWCKEREKAEDRPLTRPWRKKNREKLNKYYREYRKKSIKNILRSRYLSAIRKALKRKNVGNVRRFGNISKTGHLKDILGYSIEQLKKRLNNTMPEGYTWRDFMEGKLDIDHIRPIKFFNYNSQRDPEFKKCWALKNLRLLTIKENRSRKFKKRWGKIKLDKELKELKKGKKKKAIDRAQVINGFRI